MLEKIYSLFSIKLVRFLFVGVINTIFGIGTYLTLIYFGFDYTLSVLLSTILGVLFNFKTIGMLVFSNKDNSLIFRFFFTYAITFFLNIQMIGYLKAWGYDNYVSGLICVIPIALIGFMLNKFFVFRNPKQYL